MSLKFKLFVLIVIMLPAYGCIKDNLKAKYLLTDEMKNQNPYQTGDTVMFINANSDTLKCTVSRKNNIIKALLGINTNDYNLFEEEKTYISGDSFSISMRMYHEPRDEPSIDILTRYGDYEVSVYKKPIPLTFSSTPSISSIEINNKWYYQVYYFENNYQNTTIYYSTEYGVLRVEFKDGDFIDYVGVNK